MIDRKLLAFAFLTVVAACDDPPDSKGLSPVGDVMDAALGSGSPEGGLADASVPRSGPVYAVISSDFSSTSVSLLDVNGELVADDYINSGTTRAGLVATLSGDVAVPTRTGEQGVLVLIDRFRTDVVTRIRLADGTVLGQVRTETPPSQAGQNVYSSNPQDYLYIDPETAWVVRSEPNLDPAAPASDRGTDLLRLNPTTMERTDDRIDLSSFNAKGMRTNPDTQQQEQVDVYARPGRMVRAGDTLVVGLARLSFDFSASASGMVAVVDLKTRAVQGVELPGLANCDRVTAVPDSSDTVLVSCQGFGAASQTGGLALIRVGDTPALSQIWRASEHPDQPPATADAVSLGGTWVGAVAFGSSALPASGSQPAVAAIPSRFMVFDLAGGTSAELFRTEDAYAIGPGAFDAPSGVLLVPDGSVDADKRPTRGVRRFRRTGAATFDELPTIPVAQPLGMPVRSIDTL